MHNEGFGKKWIERILGKVDKDQGVANAGKVLGIGNDGQVVPVEQSGGGSGSVVEAISNIGLDELKTKVKVGDNLLVGINYRVASSVNANNLTPVVVDGLTHFTGDMSPSYVMTDKTCLLTIRSISSNIALVQNPIVYHRETPEITINSVKYPLYATNVVYPNLIGSSGITTFTVGEVILGGNSGVIPRHANIYTSMTTSSINGYIIHNS